MRRSTKTISNHKMETEREIVLLSLSVKTGNNRPGNFTTKFNQQVVLDPNAQYVVGLNRIINMSFTWFNINAGYNNQLIKFSSENNGKTFQDISLPAGVWTYEKINAFIQKETVVGEGQSPESGKDVFPISLAFNTTTFGETITMEENYQLDFTQSNFHDLLGFDKKIPKDKINVGPRVPNLSQDTDMLNVHCDLTNDSLVDGQDTDIIYSFSTSVLRSSYSFTLEPMRVIYSPVNKNTISSIRICITDGKRRLINLNWADTAFTLILKKSNKMKAYEFSRYYNPKGTGVIADNIFKPMRVVASAVFKTFAKPVAKKALEAEISYIGEKLGKKMSEKSGDLIMKKKTG